MAASLQYSRRSPPTIQRQSLPAVSQFYSPIKTSPHSTNWVKEFNVQAQIKREDVHLQNFRSSKKSSHHCIEHCCSKVAACYAKAPRVQTGIFGLEPRTALFQCKVVATQANGWIFSIDCLIGSLSWWNYFFEGIFLHAPSLANSVKNSKNLTKNPTCHRTPVTQRSGIDILYRRRGNETRKTLRRIQFHRRGKK